MLSHCPVFSSEELDRFASDPESYRAYLASIDEADGRWVESFDEAVRRHVEPRHAVHEHAHCLMLFY